MGDLKIFVVVALTSFERNEVLRLHLDSTVQIQERRRGLSYKNTIDFEFDAERYCA